MEEQPPQPAAPSLAPAIFFKIKMMILMMTMVTVMILMMILMLMLKFMMLSTFQPTVVSERIITIECFPNQYNIILIAVYIYNGLT